MKKLRATTVLFIILLLASWGWRETSPAVTAAPAPRPAWDQAFNRRSGWTGGDVAATVVLPRHRVLWLFGDSFIGAIQGNRRVRSTLVNNAIAIQPLDPAAPARPPAPERLQFFWGPVDAAGKPTAWVRPDAGRVAGDTWFWPTGGGVVVPGPGGSSLALFLLRIQRTAAGGAFGFDCIGSVLAVVGGVDGPVEKWRTRLIALPHESALPLTPGEEIDWGTAALYEQDPADITAAAGPSGWVYIYGVRADVNNRRDLLLARVRPAGLASFADWEFWQGGEWAAEPDLAYPVVSDVASELSVERVEGAGGASPGSPAGTTAAAHYLMVSSEPFLGDHILLRSAPSPAGPWSAPREVYQVPAADRTGHRFAYAARGHAALSPPGSILISYVVNSNDLTDLINADIYRPRFFTAPREIIEH